MDDVDSVKLWGQNRAFFQASLIKGGRYLDDAGKILNDYLADYDDGTVGLEGLRLAEPKKDGIPDEIRVDTNRIWIACYGEDCIRRMIENAATITGGISQHIGVDSYGRLGLRVYHFKLIDNLPAYCQKLHLRTTTSEVQTLIGSSDNLKSMTLRTRFLRKPFTILLGIEPIVVVRVPKRISDWPGDGMVIDIDVVENNESSTRKLSRSLLTTFLKESSDYAVDKANETVLFLRELE